MKMTEDKEKTLEFIENYQTYRLLWDTKHNDYTNKTKRNNALAALGHKHNVDVKTVKSKIKSLRSYLSKEHQKVVTKNDDAGAEDYYESSWFAYKSLSFILDSITTRETRECVENTSEMHLEPAYDTSIQDEDTDFNAPNPVQFLSDKEHEFVQPMQTKRTTSKTEGAQREPDPYNFITNAAEQISNQDEYATFGQLIAHKLRKLNPRNRILAERQISNMFFDLELEELDSVTFKLSNRQEYPSVPLN